MKRINNFSIIALLVLAMSSCKKEPLLEAPTFGVSESPVFIAEGSLNGNAISFQAGLDNTYMYTSSGVENGVNYFTGNLSNGTDNISLKLYDGQLGAQVNYLALVQNNIGFTNKWGAHFIEITKEQLVNSSEVQDLDFTVNGVLKGDTLKIDANGVYQVCVNVQFNDGTSKNICNELVLGYKDLGDFSIKHITGSTGGFHGWLDTDETIQSVEWIMDGSTVGTNEHLEFMIPSGIHEVKTKVHFANGVYRERSIIVDGDASGRFFDDMNLFKTQIAPNYYNDFKLALEMNYNGQNWKHNPYGNNSTLYLKEMSYFGKNAANKNVYKIDLEGDIQVIQNGSTQNYSCPIHLVFGIEVP